MEQHDALDAQHPGNESHAVGNGAAPETASPRAARKGGDKVDRMGTGSIPKLIVEFAIPSILGMLVNGAYNIIDSIFLGQAVGEIGLSTATTAMPLMTLFMALAMLVGNGGNALAALRMGQGDRGAAQRCLGNTITLGIVLAVIVFVFTQIPPLMDAVLAISGATALDWEYSRLFIQILGAGFIFQVIGAGVNNFIRTAGAPTRALVTMVIGAVFCTIFNFLFVMILGWGVAGSALATLCGQFASCVCVMWYFIFTKSCPMRLHVREMRPDMDTIRRILALGFASFVMQIGMAVVNLVLNNLLNMYGAMTPIGAEGAKASIGVVGRIAMFTVLPLIGVAIAIQPLEGYNYGARLFDRVRKTLWDGVIGATAIAVLGFALVHIFPVQIISFFGITDPNLRDFTIFALQVQLMMLPFVGFQIVVSNYFQATGQPVKSIFLSLTRQILFLIPLYIVLPMLLPVWFPQYTGLDALYFAVPVADFLAIFTALVFILVERKRLHKLETGERGEDLTVRPVSIPEGSAMADRKSRTRSVAYVGMTVALLAVSAWIALPLGPVPFTLQTFVLAFSLMVLRPSECLAALGAYLLLGAAGVPVFSGMRGGIGMILGATGGFLWGFLLGAVAALLLLRAMPLRGERSDAARGFAACLAFLLVSYACGWIQLMAVAGMGPLPAFLAAIAPFIVPDLAKLAVAVVVALAVRRALPSLRKARAGR